VKNGTSSMSSAVGGVTWNKDSSSEKNPSILSSQSGRW
jgi:hypothetical protein